ncbi:cadherin-like domain-containing protein [bacterium]|nr:cadherin-like domain-containing protein [bacterium]
MKNRINRPHPSPRSIPCLASPRAAFLSLVCCGALLGSAQAATRSASGTTLNIDLNVANQVVTVVSTGTTYTFTLSGGATNTWAGSGTGTVVATTKLTVTPGTTYNAINLTDSATGTAVTFATSGVNAYVDDFNVTLDNTPGAVTFNGSSSFTGAFGLRITTARNIAFASASSLSLVNGNLTLDANTQVTPTAMLFSGILVDNATVTTTGSGITTLRARGGTGSNASYWNKGIAVIGGGSITGGTTGTMTLEGRGFAGVTGPVEGQGVLVNGRNSSTLAVSTITSKGADVSVTGYGAENTDPAIANFACNAGVAVGGPSPNAITYYGKITSGGNGAVTVTGYGGTVVAKATSVQTHCSGVYLVGTDAMITSGGAGKVTVNGTGGGPASNSLNCLGVMVYYTANGGILGGPGASVEVTGRGSEVAGSGSYNHYGVWVQQGRIKAGVGAGTTRVTGYGGGIGTASTGDGIYLTGDTLLTTPPSITSDGSGSVTVLGQGANASGNFHRGIYMTTWASISSGGGDVRVEGNAGGTGTSANNYGIGLTTGGSITAGGMGNVTVIGWGGNNLSATAGIMNSGVSIESGGGDQTPGSISSSGGNITVEGYGGGGSADSPSGSSSGFNFGVALVQGGYITAGGSGNVTVTGQGGNLTPGASGNSNTGVSVAGVNGPTSNLYSSIRSSGGAVTVSGTGGGPQTGTGISSSNVGVKVSEGGTITAGGTGTVTVNGTGGSPSTSATGGSNYGVNVDGTTTPAKITSNNGNVIVTGTGGSQGSGANNFGIYLNAGGKITSDGSATTVSLTGTGGNSSGTSNYGLYVTGGTSPNFSTVSSGGGSVSILGNGGGKMTSAGNSGVAILSGGLVTSGGSSGTVTLHGQGGNLSGTGGGNSGIVLSTSTITSGGGDLALTATEGGQASSTAFDLSTGTVTTAVSRGSVSLGGAISLTGDSYLLGATINAGAAGTVNLAPRSNGVALNLGLAADTRGGPIALTSTELNLITAGTINLGNAQAGAVTVSQAITVPTGSDLNLITAPGASLTPSASGIDLKLGAGKLLDWPSISSLNLAITGSFADTGYQKLVVAGDLSLTGKSLNLSGTYTPVAGSVFTIVSATNLSGTFDNLPNGEEVLFNGSRLTIGYTATSVTLTLPPASPPVMASTPPMSDVTAIGTILRGEVTSSEATVTQRGIVYSITATNAAPQINGTGVTRRISSGTIGPFSVSADGLTSKTTYSFRAYAISSAGTSYGTVGSFTTLAAAPLFDFAPFSVSVTATGASLIIGPPASSDEPVTERGFVYSITGTNATPAIGGTGVTKLDVYGSATGLTSKTTYSFRSYAISSAGTGYSPVGTFTTAAAAPLLVFVPTSASITVSGATLGGEVTSSDATVTERGIVYSITTGFAPPPPQIGGTGVTKLSTSGTTGAFTVSATGLTSKSTYIFRAYAISSAGTSYSGTVSFTTLASPPTFSGYAVTTKEADVLSLALKKILARATDPDGGAVSLTRVFGPSAQGGVVSLTGSPLTGTLSYTPAAGFVGADSFDIELTGSRGGILRATLNLTVTADTTASFNQSELKLHDGVADLMFRGIPGQTYTIQRSTNLLNWTTIGTVTATLTGKIVFTDTAPPAALRLLPHQQLNHRFTQPT